MLSICLALLENPEDKLRFEEFYNKFYNIVYFIAKDHLKTKELAEDCAQEIMIHFAKDFHNINQNFDDNKFRAYVRVVAKSISIDMYRKEKKHFDNISLFDITEFNDIAVEEFNICDTTDLKDAVNAMPESYKYIFYLKYYFQFTSAEISRKTGIPEPSVRQKCMLGKRFVKNFVKEDENNG